MPSCARKRWVNQTGGCTHDDRPASIYGRKQAERERHDAGADATRALFRLRTRIIRIPNFVIPFGHVGCVCVCVCEIMAVPEF